jgi:hypothetical protein
MPTETRDILELMRAHTLRDEREMKGLSSEDREIVLRDLLWLAADEIERLRGRTAKKGEQQNSN